MLTAILVVAAIAAIGWALVHFHLVHVSAQVQQAVAAAELRITNALHGLGKSAGHAVAVTIPAAAAAPLAPVARWFDGASASDILEGEIPCGGITQGCVSDPDTPYQGGSYMPYLEGTHPKVVKAIATGPGNRQVGAWIGQFIREHNLGDGTAVISTPEFWHALDTYCAGPTFA